MALTFPGTATNDNVAVPATGPLANLTAFSVVAWARPTALSSNSSLWSSCPDVSGGNSIRQIRISSAGAIQTFVVRTSGNANYVTTSTVTLNAWQFIVFTFDDAITSGKGAIYVGDLRTPPTLQTLATNNDAAGNPVRTDYTASPHVWGNRYANGGIGIARAFAGDLGRGQIYNRALSAADVLQLWMEWRNLAGCVNHIAFGWNGLGTQPDWSGAGTAGTVTATTQTATDVPLAAPFDLGLEAEDELWTPVASGINATATGSLVLSGTATAAANINATASDALVLSGTATATANINATATGTLVLSGTATASGSDTATATGALVLSGTATATVTETATASGALTLSGAATGTVAISATASGALQLTGASTATLGDVAVASGALALSGAATAAVTITATATGALVLTGVATGNVSGGVNATATGTLVLGGVATAALTNNATAQGGLTLGGSATAQLIVSAVASGALQLSGTATATSPNTAHASGALQLSGTATGAVALRATLSGAIVLGGVATASTVIHTHFAILPAANAPRYSLTPISQPRYILVPAPTP